jgi:DNA-directed RNA polymerase subunit alpha
MISLDQFTIKKTEEKDNVATFEIGPLPKGYGYTMGTYLRRVLLSSVPGTAITAVKIKGALHEYTTVEGLSDDILATVLSFKNVVPVSSSTEPQTLEVNVKGKKGEAVEVTAGDIQETDEVSIVNKDYVISTITKGGSSFEAQVVVERGMGYSLANEDSRKEIGMLPIDAKFSPVKLVSYEVTDTRVGKETELDLLKLHIETSGAVTPEEALFVASETLDKATNRLVDLANKMLTGEEVTLVVNEKEKEQKEVKEEEVEEPEEQDPLKVMDLNLSTRLTNALLRSNIEDLRKLEGMTEEEVMGVRGMGAKSFDELAEVLKDNNINLV